MGVIKLFVQGACPKCPQAKKFGELLRQEGYTVEEFDVETADGLAEASFYSVQSTPTFILEDKGENRIADFRGQVPGIDAIRQLMSSL